jgi:NADPH:quinone reductase-like Zn-dependent oxidoreductase
MRAVQFERYGGPEVVEIREVERPVPGEGRVLVGVRAVSVNPLDWHRMRGRPILMRVGGGRRKPTMTGLGADVAGVVEDVGSGVTEFAPGDEVMGMSTRTLAEYARVSVDGLVRKPSRLSFEEAAAVPVAATTALQGLRDRGHIAAGERVLVVGGSGGVGSFAVQIARALGAHVSAVTSTRNVELVRSLGAQRVIDYTRENYTKDAARYDLILDCVGDRPLTAIRRVLTPNGRLVVAGSKSTSAGLVWRMLTARMLSRSSQKVGMFMSDRSKADLVYLSELIEAGQIRPVIDRTYPLAETAEAIRYLERGHARGKVVVTV